MHTKPTTDEIKKYTDTLEDMLSAQKWEISVDVFDHPIGPFKEVSSGIVDETEIWIDKHTVRLLGGEEIEIEFTISDGHPAMLSPDHIWTNAYEIQNAVYKKKAKKLDERYWKLWDHVPSQQ